MDLGGELWLELIALAGIGADGSATATLGVRERVFGLEAGVVRLADPDAQAVQLQATATARIEPWHLRVVGGAGRAWWSEAFTDRASDTTYALSARVEWDRYVPCYLEYRHYSTGKRLLGEQEEHHNPPYDGLFIGAMVEF